MIFKNFSIMTFAIISLFISSLSAAKVDWVLDERASNISFFTVKKGVVGESHEFFDFSGNINANTASVEILTDSIDTQVPIRDDRMKEFLFNVEKYPVIKITTDVEAIFQNLKKKSIINSEIPARLTLNGVTNIVNLHLSVAKRGKDNLVVTSIKPVVINAVDYGLTKGIDKLSELVGGIPIVTAVPVHFVLYYKSK